ncbi:DUF3857 domain-containing transglutaminase family protein, partial [Planctomycetota bacterium]
ADWDFDGVQALLSFKGDKQYSKFNVVDIRNEEVVKVHANGTENRMVHKLRKALTDTGVKYLRTVRIPFSTSRNRVEVKYARIIKPDGQIVQSGRIRDHSGVRTSSEGAALYSSYHIKTIEFSDLEKGDAVEYQYIMHDTSPDLFTDEFSDFSYLVSLPPAERSRYIVLLPAKMKLNVGTFNADIKPEIKHDAQKNYWVYSWNITDWPGIIMERSMRPLTEYVPYVVISTMSSWKEVGEWYTFLVKDQAYLNAEMKALVKNRIKGLKTDTDKARAVFSYVRDDIRYVGIEFGRNSMKPHRAETTFVTRYGDCKDTAILLVALLKEAGIKSHVVLVRTQGTGKIAKNVASPYVFNHAICLIPDLAGKQVWLDGTTDFYRMEEVPWSDQNGLALIVKGRESRITVIPEEEDGHTGVRIEGNITLKSDGSALIDIKEYFSGQRASALQRYLNSQDRFKQFVERLYARKFAGFTMEKFETSDPEKIEKEPWYRITGKVKRFGLKRGNRIACASSINPLSLSKKLLEKERTYPFWLRMKTFQEEQVTIKAPEGYVISFYPENKQRSVTNSEFKQTAVLKQGTLSINTRFTVKDATVQPLEYGAYKEFCAYVDSAFEERIICEKK